MHINELRAWPVTLFQPSTVYLVKAFTPSSHGACWLCLKIHPPLPLCIISPLLLYYPQISSTTHLKKGHHCGSVHLLCTNSKGDRKRKVNLAFRRSAFTTMKADVTCSRSFWGENHHRGTTNTNCEMRGLPNQIIHYVPTWNTFM